MEISTDPGNLELLEADSAYATSVATPLHRGLHNRVVLHRFENLTLVNFGLFGAIGAGLTLWIALARQLQAGLPLSEFALALYLPMPLEILVGSFLFVLALDWRAFLRDPIRRLKKPGFAFQGGFFAVWAGVVLVAWTYQLDMALLCDATILGWPLGHAIGRIGCHTLGCCHGRPTKSRFGITYTNPDSKVLWGSKLGGIPLYPTQLLSSLGNVLLYGLLAWMATTQELRPGQLLATYLVVGGTGRFFIEYLRGIPVKRVLGMTPFQGVSLSLAAVGAVIFYIASFSAPHAGFQGDLFSAMATVANDYWYIFIVFCATIFLGFGIHGPCIGDWSRSATHAH